MYPLINSIVLSHIEQTNGFSPVTTIRLSNHHIAQFFECVIVYVNLQSVTLKYHVTVSVFNTAGHTKKFPNASLARMQCQNLSLEVSGPSSHVSSYKKGPLSILLKGPQKCIIVSFSIYTRKYQGVAPGLKCFSTRLSHRVNKIEWDHKKLNPHEQMIKNI